MAYDINAIKPMLPLPKEPAAFTVSRFTLNNRAWRSAVDVLCAICDHLTDDDRDKLTRYEGRRLSGEKAEQTVIALRRVLLHRDRHQYFVCDGEKVAATKWTWEQLEMVYEMLCWSEGFTVQ